MSRPRFQRQEEQRKLVRTLAAIGLPHEQICVLVDLRSPKTLRKYFRKELNNGAAEAEAMVLKTAYEMAASGKCLPMTLFWEKCSGSIVERQERQQEQEKQELERQRSERPKILFRAAKEERDAA